MAAAPPSPSFADIRDDFAMLEAWDDRYRYLIELGQRLEPLPDGERTSRNKVQGCASQVWLWTRTESADGKLRLRLVGDSDAHIVRGLVALALALFNGRTPEEIEAIDPEKELASLDLAAHLSSQRSNGFRAMVARIKSEARALRASAAGVQPTAGR